MRPLVSISLGVVALFYLSSVAFAGPVLLNTWTDESYPAVSFFNPGVWTVSADLQTVTQSINGQPTLFYSDFTAQGSDVRGTVRVNSAHDDDYIGFALGFRPGDSGSSAAEYLLVDWKQADQFFDFSSPSLTPGSTAKRGLAVSRVTGVPTADEFWGHTNFASDSGGGLTELARGTNLTDTGWLVGVQYEFRFIFQPNRLQVFVDNVLELDIMDAFSDGRMAFYNFSQEGVTYSGFTVEPAPIPEPSSFVLVGTGATALLGCRFRRGRIVKTMPTAMC